MRSRHRDRSNDADPPRDRLAWKRHGVVRWGSPVGLAILLVGAVAVLLGFAVLASASHHPPLRDSAKGGARVAARGHEHRL